MMGKPEYRAAELAEHVQVARFGGKGQSGCSKCRLSIQARSTNAGASQKVSDRFQSSSVDESKREYMVRRDEE